MKNAHAELVGIACVVEKTFEGGREFLADLGVRIESLVVIVSMENGGIQFADDIPTPALPQRELRGEQG